MRLIQTGRVRVNDELVTEPSRRVRARQDRVMVDGKLVEQTSLAYVMFHKPAGCVTTCADRFAEKTIYDLLPSRLRHLRPVGRLDKDTQGLLVLTNDGQTALRLTHPRFHLPKRYEVGLAGPLTEAARTRLERGIVLDGRKTAPAEIRFKRATPKNTRLWITLREGRKRQIRRMFAAVGCRVVFLKRWTQGPLSLGRLKVGDWRFLTETEVKALREACLRQDKQ